MSKVVVSSSVRAIRSAAWLAAVAGSLIAGGLAQGQATSSAWFTESATPTGTVEQRLTQAADLLASGRVIRARAMVMGVLGEGGMGLGLSDAERGRALSLNAQIQRRVQTMDPGDVSLQKAELAIAQGDLVMAQRQAEAVRDASSASAMQQASAMSMLDQIESRRIELELLVPQAMDRIAQAFEGGRVEEAKAIVDGVQRSGVALSDEQRVALVTAKSRVLAIEAGQGTVLAGAMQPGVVNRNQNIATQPTGDPLVDEARRVAAQSLRAEADGQFARGEYARANEAYNRLLTDYRQFLSSEEITLVEDRLRETRTRVSAGGGQPLSQVEQDREIERQRISAEYQNLMEQARTALAQDNVESAGRLVARAEGLIDNSQSLFAQAQVDQFKADAAALAQRVEARRNALVQGDQARTASQLAEEARRREAQAAADRENQKRELLRQVRALQQELKYADALQVVDQILFLDPTDVAALFMRDILVDTMIYRQYNADRMGQIMSYTEQVMENNQALFAPTGIVNFPPDWPAISFRRGEPTAYADSPENRRVLAQLETTRTPIRVTNATLENVVTFLEGVTSIDFDPDWDALEVIGVERGDPVTLNLSNATISTILDRVLTKVSGGGFGDIASWAIQDGVVVISSDEELRKQTELVIYDIRDLVIEVPDYDNAPDFDLQSVLQSGGGGGGGGGQSPFQENDQNEQNRIPLEDRIQRIRDIITQNVDFDGWRENGGDTGYIQDLNSNLIITNTPRNHREIAGLLAKLREIRAMQINVESRFLLVNQDFFEQVGFDLDIYFNATSNQVTAARGTNPNTLPSDFFNFERGGYQRTTRPPGPTSTEVANVLPSEFSPVAGAQNSLGLAQQLAGGSFASDILAASPALGIAGQFLDDIQVDFLVRATQADRRSVSLNAPRLTFTNGQRSNIYVATQVSFVSDLNPIVSDSAVGFDPTIDVISEGVVLDAEGTVTGGRRYVTLNLTTSVSQLARPFRTQTVTAVAGGQLVNSADTQSFIELPEATVTSVSTTVTVPDQGTILIGGQRLVSEFEVETGVPILSKIPILNRFFTNRIESKEEQTLLILIKPTILIQNEEEENAYPGIGEQMRANFGG